MLLPKISSKHEIMTSKDLDFLKEENLDVYELLEVPFGATDSAIRKAYRKQALIYHPDKTPDPSAAVRFHRITVSLNVLANPTLRKEYDAWINSRKAQHVRDELMSKERKRMKDELASAEKRGQQSWSLRTPKKSQYFYANEVERLREEGLQKRRKLEGEQLTKDTPLHDSTTDEGTKLPLERTVRVKWKIKPEIASMFTEDVIAGIMSAFGKVESVKKIGQDPNEKRIQLSIVVFKSSKGAKTAISHDFSKTSQLWEGTSYRKLSGLMKFIEWFNANETGLSLEEYKDLTVEKMRTMQNLKKN
jgi:DnaJ family protein C protein 17